MINYNFKRVEKKYSRFTDQLSITKSKTLGMPTAFWDLHKIESYKYAVFYFDNEKRALGIHFTSDDTAKDKTKIVNTKKYGGYILMKNFFSIYKLDVEKYSRKYDYKEVEVENIGKLFVIELKEKEAVNP